MHLTTRAWKEVDIEGIAFEILALTLYLVKYEDLPKNEEPDECKFAWSLVDDEHCSINKGTLCSEEMTNRLLMKVVVQNQEQDINADVNPSSLAGRPAAKGKTQIIILQLGVFRAGTSTVHS